MTDDVRQTTMGETQCTRPSHMRTSACVPASRAEKHASMSRALTDLVQQRRADKLAGWAPTIG